MPVVTEFAVFAAAVLSLTFSLVWLAMRRPVKQMEPKIGSSLVWEHADTQYFYLLLIDEQSDTVVGSIIGDSPYSAYSNRKINEFRSLEKAKEAVLREVSKRQTRESS